MTRQEFETIFNDAYKLTLKQTSENVTASLRKHSDENGKISSEDIVALVLVESFKMNSTFLKQILEKSLEFDD